MAHIMGNAKLVADSRNRKNKVIDLSGHDEWVEVYRDNCLELTGSNLTQTYQFLRLVCHQRRMAVRCRAKG